MLFRVIFVQISVIGALSVDESGKVEKVDSLC